MKSEENNRFLNCATVMWRVIVAVILRETKTRFGKHKMGYLWALIEPMSYVGVLIVVRTFMHASIPFGESVVLFLLTGILTFRLFTSISKRATSSISANQALLTYPIVKPVDTIFARLILESVTMLVVFFIFFTLLGLVVKGHVVHNPPEFAAALCATIFLAFGVGAFNAVLSILVPTWERIWSIVAGLPLLILSAVFYIPKSLPPTAQLILSWNPVLNCIEWLRYATYLDYDPLLNRTYVIYFSAVFFVTGLVLERTYRHILVRS
ncbi:polyhydroxyalkanoate biosynthesis repressor PhaR [Ochrobactrum sp. MYb68]|nr:polyhydroxyalkanoate biosynthesis repressor PhaR [Ochrobactrum sp. MYb68]